MKEIKFIKDLNEEFEEILRMFQEKSQYYINNYDKDLRETLQYQNYMRRRNQLWGLNLAITRFRKCTIEYGKAHEMAGQLEKKIDSKINEMDANY